MIAMRGHLVIKNEVEVERVVSYFGIEGGGRILIVKIAFKISKFKNEEFEICLN